MLLSLNDEETASSIYDVISGLDEFTSAYNFMPTRDLYSHFHFALNYEMRVRQYNQRLRDYSKELDKGECKEVFNVEREMLKKEYWEKDGVFKHNLSILNKKLHNDNIVLPLIQANGLSTFDNFIQSINHGLTEFVSLLNEIKKKLVKSPLSIYGKYYQYQKAKINKEDIISAYEEWKLNTGKLTFERLKTKQTVIVADFLKWDMLRFSHEPSQRELDKVKLEIVRAYLPCRYKLSEDFVIQCAKFRRFISWKDDILNLDYDILGKYLFQHYYELKEEERFAFYELDIMLGLVNNDLGGLESKQTEDIIALLPEQLATEKALNYWALLKKHDFVDSNYMLLESTSRQQAMYIAEIFAEKMNLPSKWKLFENFWGIKNLAQEKNKFLETGKSPARYNVIDKIFEE